MRIPGIDIHEKIGEGSMATVWKAQQVSLDRPVALKVLKPQAAAERADVKSFLEEARAIAKLKHPAILPIYDVGETEGTCYFIMEYVNGSTLLQIITRRGAIAWADALKILIPVAEALDHAWSTANITHRGLKPSNILIDRDGVVRVADFGMSRALDPLNLTRHIEARHLTVTTNFCSPEQAACAVRVDFRSDMYSLGAIFYHMLTGRMPFATARPLEALEKHRHEQLKSPREQVPGIHRNAELVLMRLMMKDPEDRYPSWTAALDDMRKAATGRGTIAAPGPEARSTIMASAVPKPPTGTAASVRVVERDVPAWFKGIAWLLLVAWWGWFALQEFSRPVPAPQLPPTRPPTASPRPRPAPAPAERTSAQAVPATPSPTTTTTVPPAPPDLDIRTFKAGLADAALTGDFPTALAIVEQELQYSHPAESEKQLEEIQSFLVQVAAMNTVLEDAFRAKVGQVITLKHKGQEHRVTVQKVQNGTVEATQEVTTNSGSSIQKSTNFQIRQLDPEEQARWLGSADTPAKAAMKFVLLMRAKKPDAARQFAASSGPLSDVFLERAGDKPASK